MTKKRTLHLETVAAQANHAIDPQTGGVVPSLQPASTYARDHDYQLTQAGTEYSRDDNPTVRLAEQTLKKLENGKDALLFSSGMAAIAALFRSLAPGSHVVAPTRMYFGSIVWLKDFAYRHDLNIRWFDPAQPASLSDTIQPNTNLVWIETPANPTWEITDIQTAGELARQVGATLAVDSTVATPALSQTLDLGADIVFHSATKYLNGHSDLTAGALIVRNQTDLWKRIRFERHMGGAVLGAFEAWLLLRGMRTLFVRVEKSCHTALTIARHFEHHPKLERVLYPGLKDHPGHEIAIRQMQGGFGAMVSILVKGGASAALKVARQLRVFVPATSLGGVESLVEHRKTVESPESLTPDNLLRLSIGIENDQDLIADLEQALDSL